MSGSTPSSSGADVVLTTKGDIVGYDTVRKRIGVGTDDQVLTADSTNGNGLAWKDTSGGTEFQQITTATTFTPTTQTGLTKVSIDLTDVTAGQADVNVDGSSIINSTSGVTTRVINPATSLNVVTSSTFYDIANASYDSKTYDVSSQELYPQALAFKDDGTKMYVCGDQFNRIYQYSLSTAWDISTASYDSIYFGALSYTQGLWFKSDGTKMFTARTTTDIINRYSLSTAWNVSTATIDAGSLNVSAKETNLVGVNLKPDGTEIYATGGASNTVHQYTMSTAYDLATASFTASYDVSAQESILYKSRFNSDGTKMFINGLTNDKVHQYSLSTAYNVTTASYDNISFSFATQTASPRGLCFKPDGSKMYTADVNGDVWQYTTEGTFTGSLRASVG
jgi:hypothetical protein